MGDRDLAVVILAAGQGTRMRSTLPKLLHRVGGVPLINHVLDTASTLPSSVVIAVVRHERERVSEAIHSAMPAAVIVDQDDIAGTGRAAQVAVDALPVGFDGDVLILNGDVPLLDSATVSAFVRGHQDSDAALSLLSAILPDATGYGRIVRDLNGTVQRIVEERDASSDERAITEVNGGVYLVGAAALRDHLSQLNTNNAQGERYLTDVIQSLREAGAQIDAIPVERPWELEGVNDRAQLSEAEARMNALIIRGWQLAGVTIKDPASTWIDITATIAPDVEILPGCHIAGATDIASGAVIGPDTTLLDCEVGEGATVKRTDATLAVIGAGASVGPYSYLRPGTQLGAGGKIGTFVETKNAVIGDGSKVPHLSYIGDAEVGEQSNIGAGTIVANYDGVNKHRTTVGSHVRTGSHNVFVAPVTIGDGAYSGAGTVVRKDVPSGSLAISVAPQRNVAGWVQKNRPGSEAAAAAAEADGNSAADR